MDKIRPYIVVPVLIEQPTWGGEYIPRLKGVSEHIADKKIGQSYELYEHSRLTTNRKTNFHPTIALAQPSTIEDHPIVAGDATKTFPISQLEPMIGKVDTLIKLNQALGNSYQLHVKRASKHWKSKPESWFFMEPGLVSLGVKAKADWQEYEDCCRSIDAMAQELVKKIDTNELSLGQARSRLQEYIDANHPRNFVNLVQVGKNQAIDLSKCGVHHSWEDHDLAHPHGNVVYEVQKNVYDDESTIRAFDRGKITDDGKVRPVHIDDYFKYIDRSAAANDPDTHFRKGLLLKKTSTYTVKRMFRTKLYQLKLISFNQEIANKYTTVATKFHHLFAHEGNFELKWRDMEFVVTRGYSIFCPRGVEQYSLRPYRCRRAKVLLTSVV